MYQELLEGRDRDRERGITLTSEKDKYSVEVGPKRRPQDNMFDHKRRSKDNDDDQNLRSRGDDTDHKRRSQDDDDCGLRSQVVVVDPKIRSQDTVTGRSGGGYDDPDNSKGLYINNTRGVRNDVPLSPSKSQGGSFMAQVKVKVCPGWARARVVYVSRPVIR